ncbi:MAG: DUF2244 domain-containing protein [Thiomonas sp.]|jgi:uncharacterized membrane protein
MTDALCPTPDVQTPFTGSLLSRPQREQNAWVWRFRRNCSISPRQLLGVFVSFALGSALLAVYCWSEGARLVAPFAVIEVLAVGAALLVYARHAADYERISISDQAVVVEWVFGARQGRLEFHPRHVRIVAEGHGLVQVADKTRQVWIGRHLRPDRRAMLARDLRRAILLS